MCWTDLYDYIISLKQLTISCNNQIKQISNLDNSLFVNLNILEDNGMKNEMNAPQKIVWKKLLAWKRYACRVNDLNSRLPFV